METLNLARKAHGRSILSATGHVSSTPMYGFKAIAPTDEQRILQLPAYAKHRLPLQDEEGRAYFMPGIDTPGDPNHPVR